MNLFDHRPKQPPFEVKLSATDSERFRKGEYPVGRIEEKIPFPALLHQPLHVLADNGELLYAGDPQVPNIADQ